MQLKAFFTRFLNIVKILLIVLTFGFIFYKLFYAYHIGDLISRAGFSLGGMHLIYVIITVLLMACNWMTEASKWRLLMNKNEDVSFTTALKAVTSGIALSIITPNQIGDFVGRIIHLKRFDKIKGTLVTIIGHTAQVIMSASMGVLAMIWFLHNKGRINDSIANVLYTVVAIGVVILIYSYLHISFISRLKISKRIQAYLSVFELYRKSELVQVLMFAFIRYSIFLVQYTLLLKFYYVDISYEQAIPCIIAALFAQSFVPSFILIELGMRGASALWFFGLYTDNVVGVLLSAYSLWMINLMLPGLVGLGVILNWRLSK